MKYRIVVNTPATLLFGDWQTEGLDETKGILIDLGEMSTLTFYATEIENRIYYLTKGMLDKSIIYLEIEEKEDN